ncbi:hypothetical protein CEXT_135681 [Caerostris extrusa]|uniref:Uncharacterized protein n=1 Tax=Caerostris extrusa TaxID=172846 RepID=A0AAV4QJ88_CAEEX|nr:hypothetical protein CEXT_135681 [Caerostris extrusa]
MGHVTNCNLWNYEYMRHQPTDGDSRCKACTKRTASNTVASENHWLSNSRKEHSLNQQSLADSFFTILFLIVPLFKVYGHGILQNDVNISEYCSLLSMLPANIHTSGSHHIHIIIFSFFCANCPVL